MGAGVFHGAYASSGHFALDMNSGMEYEIVDRPALIGMIDILLPNLAPRKGGEKVIARFMFSVGVFYYLSL